MSKPGVLPPPASRHRHSRQWTNDEHIKDQSLGVLCVTNIGKNYGGDVSQLIGDVSKLRVDAEYRLKHGAAPPTKGWPTGVNALNLLFDLASNPNSAVDALRLLHELQVYQVELDLQHEQLEITRDELSEDLAHYKGLYEFAPMAHFCLSHQDDIVDSNLAGAALFGVGLDELYGCSLDSFLAPDSRPVFHEMLLALKDGGSKGTCHVQTGGNAKVSSDVHVVASATPGGKFSLVVFFECDRSKAN